ncbi:MAG: M56 family metallopeptidase [Alphaproteobacteria bacterium]|nr:M56 family metallopeptidase [Alphaproteobacteria bacterium]
MSSLIALRALLFGGECFLGAALILALAWLATENFRGTASQRHLVWLAAFGAVLVLPLLAAILPSQIVIMHPVPPPVQSIAALPVVAASAAPAAPMIGHGTLAMLVFAVWFAGVCWIACRGAIGLLGLRALHRRSVPYFLEGIDASKLAIARRNWKLRLSTAPGGAGPITWGFFRPVVLLPKVAVLWPCERLEAVLLHEVAHVRRYDSLTQALSLLACALYWPNPLVWLAARALRREAEIAADDAVIRSGVKASSYAEELLRLAAEFRPQRTSLSDMQLSMAGRSALEARVKSILAPTQSRAGVTVMNALKIAGLGLLATSVLALARPSFADEQQTPSPAPSVVPAPAVQDDDMAAPPVPPPAPAIPPEPAIPPAPAAPAIPPAPPAGTTVRIMKFETPGSVKIMQWEGSEAAVNKAMALDSVKIQKAIADAKIAETVARAMREVTPKVNAAVARAMREAKPDIEKAIADARIAENVARAVQQEQPEIEKAIAEARKRADAAARRDQVEPPPSQDNQ